MTRIKVVGYFIQVSFLSFMFFIYEKKSKTINIPQKDMLFNKCPHYM